MPDAPVNTNKSQPINISLMDVDDFVKKNHCGQVKTVLIREPSTHQFHQDGLFSETIFGQIGSPERLARFGYIDLRCKIIHPVVYQNIIRLKSFYGDIMASKVYARWNDQTKEFERSTMDDDDANTGYLFFMDHVKDLKFQKNDSITHNEKIDVYEVNKGHIVISKILVQPAGLRDLSIDQAKPEADSINTLYRSIINYVNAIPEKGKPQPYQNGIFFMIQKKVNDVYDYLFEMMSGKGGLMQAKYSSRALALGTRNVIATTPMNAWSPTDPQFFKIDEIKVPLFQCCHMYMGVVIYYIKQLFFNDVFNMSSDQVAVIDPDTYQLRYQPITEDEKSKFLSSEGVRHIIALFRDEEFQMKPVVVYNDEDVSFYLYLVYDDGDSIFIGRSLTELKEMTDKVGIFFKNDKVRPLTYAEMLYIAAYAATENRTALVCRYPAIEVSSNVPCRVHLYTTNPGRKVVLYTYPIQEKSKLLPEYPDINRAICGPGLVHDALLSGLGADFDGDTVSMNGIISKEANDEILKYLDSPARYVRSDGSLYMGTTDLNKLTLWNLTRDPEDAIKK